MSCSVTLNKQQKTTFVAVKVFECVVQKCNLVFSNSDYNLISLNFFFSAVCLLSSCGSASPTFPNLSGREQLPYFLSSVLGSLTMCVSKYLATYRCQFKLL